MHASITVMSMSVLYLFSLEYDATPLLLCVHVVSVFLYKYDDNVSTISPTQVSKSIWSRFSFALLLGGLFFQLPKCSWVAPSPFLSP